MTTPTPLLEVSNLNVSFRSEAGRVQAVRGVSYSVQPGETLAIVGESGSGKSVSSLAVMGLLPSNAHATGTIKFKGVDLLTLRDRELSGCAARASRWCSRTRSLR